MDIFKQIDESGDAQIVAILKRAEEIQAYCKSELKRRATLRVQDALKAKFGQGNIVLGIGSNYAYKGYKSGVYFVRYPHQWQYIKVGFTGSSLTSRMTHLAGIWKVEREDMHVEAFIRCENPREVEKHIHTMLDEHRVIPNHELFEAQPVFKFLAELQGVTS